VNPEPPGDEPFPHDEVPGDGAWPRVVYSEVRDWIR
jgi:hypothetical protein